MIKNIKYMKRLLYLLMPFLLVLGACKKFLATSPTDFVQPATYYQNTAQLTSALAAVYASLTDDPGGYGGALYGFFLSNPAQGVGDQLGERYAGSNTGTQVGYGLFDYTSITINDFWITCYSGINRANNLLANRGNVGSSVDSTDLNAMMAEAQFMRGYYYFLLVQNFGGVPLRVQPTVYPTPLNTSRAAIDSVYAQIIRDMTTAEPYLYQANSASLQGGTSRVSQTVADGILARVCLFMAGSAPIGLGDQTQYANALKWAQKVQASGMHGLLVNADTLANVTNIQGKPLAYPATNGNPAYSNNGYAQVFLNEAMGRYNSKETMWEVNYSAASASSNRMNYVGSQLGIDCGDQVLGNVVCGFFIQQYLYNLYGAGDLRRDWNISAYTNGSTTTAVRTFSFNGTPGSGQQVLNRMVGKWRREYEPLTAFNPKPKWQTTISFPILRYSDVLLMLAEAEFQVNGPTQTALNAINQVRRRGYGVDINTPDAAVDLTSATLTLSAIQDERSRELCFEAVRSGDLRRWGIYLQRLQDVINFNNTQGYPSGNRILANTACQTTLAGGTKFLLWPIPSSELLTNKAATQNPGW
jgi:hypothetical protein